MKPRREIWLDGEGHATFVRFDKTDGRVVRTVVDQRAPNRPTGGLGGRCLGGYLALYVNDDRDGLILQRGTTKIALTPGTRVRFRRFGVLYVRLTVRQGDVKIVARRISLANQLFKTINPTWDWLELIMQNPVWNIADALATPARIDNLIQIKDPFATRHVARRWPIHRVPPG